MGMVPPSIVPPRREETMGYQPLLRKEPRGESVPKDERPPLQGFGDQLEGEEEGKRMMRKVYYRSPVVPAPRIDERLIGKEYR